MISLKIRSLLAAVSLIWGGEFVKADEPSVIRHSYLVLGAKTAIIGEDGETSWEYAGGTRDGFV